MDIELYIRSFQHTVEYQKHDLPTYSKLVVPIDGALNSDSVIKLIKVSVDHARGRQKKRFSLCICVTKLLGVRKHDEEESPLGEVYSKLRFFYASKENPLFHAVEIDYGDVERYAEEGRGSINGLIESYIIYSGEPRYASSNWTFIKYLSLEAYIDFLE